MPNLFLNTEIFSIPSFVTDDIENLNFDSIDFKGLDKHKYLGKRAEYFMKAYLEQSDNFQPVYHSLQIQEEKTTLGELDFLFFDQSKQEWIHLELICKFYVFTGEDAVAQIQNWIGPNLKDRLDKKIHKLKAHQLQICQKPQAQQLFKELDIDVTQIKTKICYKAKLYLPLQHSEFNFQDVNKDCIKGQYYNFETFKRFQHSTHLFYVPQKSEWICSPKNHEHWYDFKKAKQILKPSIKDKRSCMLWRKNQNGNYFEDFIVWW